MATIEGIIKELNTISPSIDISVQNVVKNTVPMTGLCMKLPGDCVAPILYIDRFINDESMSDIDAATLIRQIYNQQGLDIDLQIFEDREYVLEHLKIGLQKADSNVLFLTKETDYDDIMQYIYISDEKSDCHFSVKITEQLLAMLNIDAEEAWKIATEHTSADIQIHTMSEILSDMMCDDAPFCEEIPFFVVSNSTRLQGSAAILNKEYIKNWALQHDIESFVIIFSSVHECLLIPTAMVSSLDDITDMICAVNSETVDPVDQLATRAYVLDIKDIA